MLSVLEQTHPDVEYIVIDGGSTDGSVDIIRKYADRLAYWVSESDRGIYDAMNKGIAHATGQYLNFMNAGDRFASPDVLAQVADTNPTATILYGNTLYKNYEKGTSHVGLPRALSEMPRWGVFCHQSALVDTVFHKQYAYDTQYKSLADYDFFRKAYLERGATFQYVDLIISEIDNGKGMSKDNIDMNYAELSKIVGADNNFILRCRLECRRRLGKLKRKLLG